MADVLRDPSKIISASDAKRGGTIDFDIGATYVLPYKIDEIDFTLAQADGNASIRKLLSKHCYNYAQNLARQHKSVEAARVALDFNDGGKQP